MLKDLEPVIAEPARISRPRRTLADVLAWEWAVAIVAAPLLLVPGWWSWGAIALLVGWRGARAITGGRIWTRTALDWPLVLVGLGLAVGLLASLDMRLSLNRVASLVAGVAIFLALTNSLNSRQVLRWAGPVIVTVGAFIAVGSLLVTDWGQGELLKLPGLYDRLPHFDIASFGSGASAADEINPRVVGGTLAMLVTLAMLYTFRATQHRLKYGLAAVVMGGVLLLTQSPSAIGGVIAAGLLFGLGRLLKHRQWLWLLIGPALLGLVGLTGAVLLPQLPSTAADPTQRIIFRLEMWLRAIDMLSDQPFTGIGLNNFPLNVNNFYPTYSLGPEAHAHNVWLQTALDGGVIGLLGLIAVLGGVTVTLRRAWLAHSSNPAARTLISGIAIGTLAWVLYGSIESITLAHKSALLLWLMWGCAAVLARDYQPAQKRAVNWQLRASVAVIALLLVGGVVGIGWNKLQLNLAIVDGHKAALSGQTESIRRSGLQLDALATTNNISAATRDLQARLAYERTDYDAARRFLAQEVALDQPATVSRYIPAEWAFWHNRGPVLNDPPLLRLYNQWKIRYDRDPLSYARYAVAAQTLCQPPLAQAALSDGQTHAPSPFLAYLQTQTCSP